MKFYRTIAFTIFCLTLTGAGSVLGQTAQNRRQTAARPVVAPAKPAPAPRVGFAGSDDVVMATEEIHIAVPTELPTVIVTIPRQQPEITSVILKKDAEDLITAGNRQVKPRLADLQINRLEQPEKMLAETRAQ